MLNKGPPLFFLSFFLSSSSFFFLRLHILYERWTLHTIIGAIKFPLEVVLQDVFKGTFSMKWVKDIYVLIFMTEGGRIVW